MQDILDAMVENYAHGLARFRLFPFLETESQVRDCADQLVALKLEYRQDLEELESILGLTLVNQAFCCWLQDIKKCFQDLYSLRCGKDQMMNQWRASTATGYNGQSQQRQHQPPPFTSMQGGNVMGSQGEEGLGNRVKSSFEEQGLEVPFDFLKLPSSRKVKLKL